MALVGHGGAPGHVGIKVRGARTVNCGGGGGKCLSTARKNEEEGGMAQVFIGGQAAVYKEWERSALR